MAGTRQDESPRGIHRLEYAVMEYAWGSRTLIPDLIGGPSPAPAPQAELWMGAHPRGPSRVVVDEGRIDLDDWIARDPDAVLGADVARGFSGELPFLFKVLAAGKPLSIQAHPNLEQAREGFAREQAAGIPVDSPERNYRDANHKPELICAISTFWALDGFRAPADILDLASRLGTEGVREIVAPLAARSGAAAMRECFTRLMTLPGERVEQVVREAVSAAARVDDGDPVWSWMRRLDEEFPGDPGVLAPILLELVRLEPGEALALPARRLHAYLEGLGVEIMASSDNVLRGGLTVKHVDVPELLRVLSFEDSRPTRLQPTHVAGGMVTWATHAREFALSRIDLDGVRPWASPSSRSVEILLATSGSVTLAVPARRWAMELERGACALVPTASDTYALEGEGTVWRAGVPLAD